MTKEDTEDDFERKRVYGGLRYKDTLLQGLIQLFNISRQLVDGFWNSKIYFPLMLALAAAFLLTGKSIVGMLLLAAIFSILMVFCADMLSGLVPLMLIFLLGTAYYEDVSALLPYWWVVVIAICSLIIHFILFPVDMRSGRSLKSLAMVSVATLMGGMGTISNQEYFSLSSIYYVLFLGLGMLAFYLMLRAELGRRRYYRIPERFAAILYTVGIFTGLVVLRCYISSFSEFIESLSVINIKYRNYCATILLTALPMPCFFLRERRLHFLGLGILYVSLLLTGSRSALLIGTALLAACIVYINSDKLKQIRAIKLRFLLLTISIIALVLILAKTLYASRMIGGLMISSHEKRVLLYSRVVGDFFSNPLFGQGLGSTKNSDLYSGPTGTMFWYHNYFAQIVGSMGLLGIFAYGHLLKDRISMLKELKGTDYWVLTLSYLGMLLMSMTNPGEFCPFPNEMLMVILFAVTEDLLERRITYAVIPINEYRRLKKVS